MEPIDPIAAKKKYRAYDASGTLVMAKAKRDNSLDATADAGSGWVESPAGKVLYGRKNVSTGADISAAVEADIDKRLDDITKAADEKAAKPEVDAAPWNKRKEAIEAAGGRFDLNSYGQGADNAYARHASSLLRAELGITWKVLTFELKWNKQKDALAALKELEDGASPADLIAKRRAELGIPEPVAAPAAE